jgi:ADP-ribose pyrophosphatase
VLNWSLAVKVSFYVSPGGTCERVLLYYGEVGEADRVSAGGGLASEQEDLQLVGE